MKAQSGEYFIAVTGINRAREILLLCTGTCLIIVFLNLWKKQSFNHNSQGGIVVQWSAKYIFCCAKKQFLAEVERLKEIDSGGEEEDEEGGEEDAEGGQQISLFEGGVPKEKKHFGKKSCKVMCCCCLCCGPLALCLCLCPLDKKDD